MPEVAPGIFVSVWVPAGRAMAVDASMLSRQVPRRWVVVHPDDWDRIDPAERERIVDEQMRECADLGQRDLERWLREGAAR